MLSINFSTCVLDGCTSIKFTETTGIYSDINTGGYGTPNPEIGSINTAILIITSPSGIEYTVDMKEDYEFPSNDINYYKFITAESLGLDSIEDGKWIFNYIITGDSGGEFPIVFSYNKIKYSLFYCNSECCIKQMNANLNLEDCGCGCNEVNYNDYIKAWSHLQALKYAAQCGSISLFTKLKKIVDKLCKNNGCKTCK